MVEKYVLTRDQLPTIPTPHDCIVTQMRINDEYIIFEFEDDVSYHDSVQVFHPDATGLTIRYHLTPFREYSFYEYRHRPKFVFPNGYYAGVTESKVRKALSAGQAYLYHYARYGSMIVELESIILIVQADWVELEWSERQQP